ncbi:hypothetical protein SLEP1_g22182 [Rubroshorea leprosula]|uniref:Uncharacterized protein n=1 Tax=Rubroshorea leprosula TaxID=152421 RepID=A0AAV5JHN9_9ROSI|nr:hypothetical protein SLEP1_g22182 [Rubroshorea leprosula]
MRSTEIEREVINEILFENGEYDNYRGRIADSSKHGGVRAASFACAVEVLENVVFLSNAINFVAYFIKSMHYPAAEAANMVTNFMGTSFLLTIVGGFISDSFFTRFRTFIFSCTVELMGLILLAVQAQYSELQPAMNKRPSEYQAAVLYVGLYAMAAGIGGIKAALPAHGADQLDRRNQRLISAFFNWYFFSLCTGGLIACTFMVWIQENKGWKMNFNISIGILSLALCIFAAGFPIYRYKRPGGSPIARMCKVFVAAIRSRNSLTPETETRMQISSARTIRWKFRFLNKALMDEKITATEVQETKTFLGLLPIFASTIMMNCCLAQLQTFTVEQGIMMGRTMKNFTIPTQSLTVFPLIIMLASIPLYERFARIVGTKQSWISNWLRPLKRIGVGLALASASMAAAAVVEAKRREEEVSKGAAISVFWLAWQYLLLGVADVLALGGMLEFFYSGAPDSMRSISTALSWCSTAMGYFISSVLVTIANSISEKFRKKWLPGHDLNHGRLDLFYTLLCALNFLNLLNYIFWAKRYQVE